MKRGILFSLSSIVKTPDKVSVVALGDYHPETKTLPPFKSIHCATEVSIRLYVQNRKGKTFQDSYLVSVLIFCLCLKIAMDKGRQSRVRFETTTFNFLRKVPFKCHSFFSQCYIYAL